MRELKIHEDMTFYENVTFVGDVTFMKDITVNGRMTTNEYKQEEVIHYKNRVLKTRWDLIKELFKWKT